MKEAYTLFGLEEGKKIPRTTLFKKYMELIKEKPNNIELLTSAYQELLGSEVITYPPMQARELVNYVNGQKEVKIPSWYNQHQETLEKTKDLMDSINILLLKQSLSIDDLTIVFRLTNVLELELNNITNPVMREYFIAYLKTVDSKLKSNYSIVDHKKLVFKKYQGQK